MNIAKRCEDFNYKYSTYRLGLDYALGVLGLSLEYNGPILDTDLNI